MGASYCAIGTYWAMLVPPAYWQTHRGPTLIDSDLTYSGEVSPPTLPEDPKPPPRLARCRGL
jgi:hypothetical protein